MADDKTYEDRVVYLTDLLDKESRSPLIQGFTFRGCQIHGPMVVALLRGVTIERCRFEVQDREQMLFEVPEGSVKVGIVGLVDCTFTDCSIQGMAIAGPQSALEQFRKGTGLSFLELALRLIVAGGGVAERTEMLVAQEKSGRRVSSGCRPAGGYEISS
ncbi:MAG TPA: hypothetical protein VHN16_00715 [Streptosporangiaceae bacterium]|nr:hypothetical protein [Streptosporangiaceae bacterium]